MQLMPATAARFGLTAAERFDPAKNIRAGIRYLKVLAQMFGGNLDLMIAAYNAGEGAVLKYGRHIPPYRETQTYVRRVKGFYARYRQRVRQRQMLASMLDVDERRLMDRSRTAEDARDRTGARAQSDGGIKTMKTRPSRPLPTRRLAWMALGAVVAAHSLCVQAEPPDLYQVVAARYGLSADALYAQAVHYAGRQSRFASSPTPWPWTVRLCQQGQCETVFADDRATLAAVLVAASRAGLTGSMSALWACPGAPGRSCLCWQPPHRE